MQVHVILDEKDFTERSAEILALLRIGSPVPAAATIPAPVNPADLPPLPMPSTLAPAAPQAPAPVDPVSQVQPQPVAAPVAPQAPAPAAAVPQVTHDSTGLPHDPRIHSPNRTQNADGSWRRKKGLDPAILAQVEAELRAAQPVASVSQAAPVPQVSAPAPVQPVHDAAAAFFGQPAPQAPAPAAPVQMTGTEAQAALFGQFAAPQPVAAPVTFPDFMRVISAGVNSGKIDPPYIGQLTERLGITSVADLASAPAKIADAFAILVADGRV